MNHPPLLKHQKGFLVAFIGAMLLTLDTPLLRLIGGEQYQVMFWRSVLMAACMFGFWLMMRTLNRPVAPLVNGRAGLAVSVLYGIANITFMSALFHTSVANIVFILALNPIFAGLFSLVWLREKLGAAMWLALFAGTCGVLIIVRDGLGQGTLLGDGLAVISALTLGLALTVTRRSGRDLSLSPALGALMSAVFAAGFVADYSFGPQQWGYMMINGVVIIPLAAGLLALAPRYISAPEVAMFYLLEAVLAPLWVWLAVGETASRASILGGAVILMTLAAYSAYRLRRQA